MVVALLDQAVVDVTLVGLSDANVGALAAHDGAERVDDGHAGHDERDDERGERGGAAHVEQRDGTQRKAQQQ